MLEALKAYKTQYVVITGGEPLLQEESLIPLLKALYIKRNPGGLALHDYVTIETNGTMVTPELPMTFRPCWVMDYKLDIDPSLQANHASLWADDYIKFVITSEEDMHRAFCIQRELAPFTSAKFAYSILRGIKGEWAIDPQHLITQGRKQDLDFTLNVQIHKFLNVA